uniref:Nicotinamide N-methyltransferase-like n=1 Tax=Geotrypetes seraphini TaxID=260995 RepID=A0A6P8NDW5_GEOSA|nr:nicotinamide N-methyltransferase-like [Geotrypetes seraphini]
MESEVTSHETYQNCFDSKLFLNTYFCENGIAFTNGYIKFVMENMHKAFTSDGVQGDTLLDICIFPILNHLYPACNSFKEIITTNFLEQNRQEIELWLKNEKGAFDWSATMKLICELEGNRDTEPEIEAKLRKKVKCVLKSDVTQNNPLDPLVLPAVDCLITCLCLEFACKDKNTFCCALNNISSMLKQGGYLILVGALGCTDYMLGERKFFTLSLDKEFLEKVIPECGYDILQLQTLIIPNPDPQSIATYKGYFFILARKQA